MDPPPPPLPLNPAFPDSPRYQDPTWEQPLAPIPGSKLRLMCSYGGHIIPRPHDKSLTYVGGETRLVVVDRNSSLSSLSSRLSHTLFSGGQFTLKYQLPDEDLDSLVSLTTEEDLENMIDEYDRTTSSSPLRPSRLRIFVFLIKPETATSMGSLLDDAKSETWFVDALNGAVDFLPRGLSESAAAIDNLLQLDNTEFCIEVDGEKGKNDASSSLESKSLSPSILNLQSIKVRVDDGGRDQMDGLNRQFSDMSVVVGQEEEKFDQGVPSGIRKPPLPLQAAQRKVGHDVYSLSSPDSKNPGGYNLTSPDSVTSDTSNASANSLSKHTFYQDPNPTGIRDTTRPPATLIIPTNRVNDQNSQIQMQQFQDNANMYMQLQQQNQQQQPFYQTGSHYINHPGTGPVPVSSYHPMYPPPPSQQQFHHPMDQQYQMYLMPVPQTQPSNSASSPAFKEPALPPYTTKIAPSNNPEVAASPYGRAATASPILVPSTTNQFQQQYVNYSQMPHPSQSNVSSYGFEYGQPTHDQMYYTHHSVTLRQPQYQTMTPASAALLSQASGNQNEDNTKQ